MSVVIGLNTEQMATRIRRVLEHQRSQPGLEPWEADSLREMIHMAWVLERRLEVWENHWAVQKERRGE